MEIVFEEKMMTSTVYIKMDACDQLLLSEGVCRQLTYHPSVRHEKDTAREPTDPIVANNTDVGMDCADRSY